ncbi:MAG TPA: hypothetical protein VIT66_00485 [Lysobacter sp.]
MKRTIVIAGGLLAGIVIASTALAAGKPTSTSGLQVVLREYGRNFVLAPGETGGVTSVCLPGETVLSGSATSIPPNATLVYSSLAYDGTNSGWTIEYKNNGAEPANVYAATSALCTAGTLTTP